MERVRQQLAAGDYDGALIALLKEWDASRAPALAALIGEISDKATAALPVLQISPQAAALRAWVELARQKRPSDVGRLLVALEKVMAAGPFRLGLPRYDELVVMDPDPRVARSILAQLGGRGWSDKTQVRAVKALMRHGDLSLAEELQRALASGDFTDTRFDKIESAWRKQTTLPGPSLEEIHAVRLALVEAPQAVVAKKCGLDAQELLAAIYADPASDDRRAIYADYLSDKGDPRGELIVIQLEREAGRSTPEAAKREQSLLKTYGKAWLGPLAAEILLGETEWRRGFPSVTAAKAYKLYQAEASCLRPEWATFERIRFNGAAVITENMKALKEARGLNETAVKRLAKLKSPPPQLDTLEVLVEYQSGSILKNAAVKAALAFPSLRHLDLRVQQWHDMATSDVTDVISAAKHLQSLRLPGRCNGRFFAPFVAEADASALRLLGWSAVGGYRVEVSRNSPGQWTHVEIIGLTGEVPEHTKRRLLPDLKTSLQWLKGFRTVTVRHGNHLDNPDFKDMIAALAPTVEVV